MRTGYFDHQQRANKFRNVVYFRRFRGAELLQQMAADSLNDNDTRQQAYVSTSSIVDPFPLLCARAFRFGEK